ncbi:MAG: uroporphyrinogen-III C-methyltransferase [Planctomycetaceae bacterium]|nr:uroporphyrinogen-III C-methyltransferase [Planctomycetaceae bacterium]
MSGRVFLVGAGPGDPGLLTLRGKACLEAADLVLYDGLVNPLLLRHSHATAQRTCRVGGPGDRHLDQAEINRQLIDAAKSGLTVCRLKGGDPFIFGRGSEEAAALAAEGIPFEVVPGITAATGAAVYAGISLTHRDHASAVAFITGHEDPAKPESAVDYEALARFPGTLVFYMGLHRLPQIVERLIAAGKSASTPAAVVNRATTPRQRTVTATLAELPGVVAAARLTPPSLVIVGEVVRVRAQAKWFEDRPLFGKVIGITRPEDQADTAIDQAVALGALPVVIPTIEIGPPPDLAAVDAMLDRVHEGEFDWLVFTSANGVRGLLSRLWQRGGDMRSLGLCELAAIGPSTKAALAEFSLRCEIVPLEYRAEALADALAPLMDRQRVLWVRADRGRNVLPERLTAAGALLEQIVVYTNRDVTTLPAAELAMLERGELDWIGLSSPSIARNLSNLLTPTAQKYLGTRTRLCAISPVTADAASEAGLPITVTATNFTWDGMFAAMASYS